MKLLLSLLISFNVYAGMSVPIPAEISAYQSYVDRLSLGFDQELKVLQKRYEENGITQSYILKVGIFTSNYSKRLLQLSQMEAYVQVSANKMMKAFIPFGESMAQEMFKHRGK